VPRSEDDKFLELAVNGRADLIVAGDADLLAFDPFRKIPNVSLHLRARHRALKILVLPVRPDHCSLARSAQEKSHARQNRPYRAEGERP
jgi:hypothetical protein